MAITSANDVLAFESNNYQYITSSSNGFFWCKFISAAINSLIQAYNNIHMKPGIAGTYRVEVKGNLKGQGVQGSSQPKQSKLIIRKNADAIASSSQGGVFQLIQDNIPYGEEFEVVSPSFPLEATDSICIVATRNTTGSGSYALNGTGSTIEVKLIRVDPLYISFDEALTDFSIRDFLTEIVHRFGLTMYKDKYSPHYTFLTLQEQLQTADVVDWSGKFVKKISENYIYGNYARQNWMRYNYNDKESSYKDGHIDVGNVNLQDSRDIIKSKIYAPEKTKSTYFLRDCNVYKLWEKELQENSGEIVYKPLDKRYYFIKSEKMNSPLNLFSADLEQSQNVNTFYLESFSRLSFAEIKEDYYGPLEQILDKSAVMNVELYLDDNDIANFDFRKLYYISQLSNYFIVNKINNYIPGKPVKCELVRVLYDAIPEPAAPLAITSVLVYQTYVEVSYTISIAADAVDLQILGYLGNPTSWYTSSQASGYANPWIFYFQNLGDFKIRLKAGNQYSNEVQVHIPSITIITP